MPYNLVYQFSLEALSEAKSNQTIKQVCWQQQQTGYTRFALSARLQCLTPIRMTCCRPVSLQLLLFACLQVGYSAILFYGYVGLIGLMLYACLRWWFKSKVSLAQVWCIYGKPWFA